MAADVGEASPSEPKARATNADLKTSPHVRNYNTHRKTGPYARTYARPTGKPAQLRETPNYKEELNITSDTSPHVSSLS